MGEGRQVGKEAKIRSIIFTIIGIIIAVYILFPFYLVLLNAFKNQASIVSSPINFAGASIKQLTVNLSSVVNNSNFNFWYAFGTSAVITVLSLILLALFGAMAAWVISRNNNKKWAIAIYMVFIASMIIPFQVVMLPLISTFRDVGKFVGI
nr:carbohydrate ABC transporter permease [Lachnospiraceae bacterium]